MEQTFEFGVCVKNLERVVLSQNEICKTNCGDMTGKLCERGCMNDYPINAPQILLEGMTLSKNSEVDGRLSDVVVINNNKTITSIIYPLIGKHQQIEEELGELKEYGLTKSEMQIMNMIIKGKKNAEIATELFIAKSTLKTHLNNIYKKLPAKWHYLKTRK